MSCPHKYSRVNLLAAATLCVALFGCTSAPAPLEARPGLLPALTKIARPMAFLHTKAFREDIRTVEPYGNKYYLPLKTGEASDRALRLAYARVFEAPREIASLEDLRALGGPQAPAAVIEPAVVALEYLNASGRVWGPYYAEIVYRFALSDAAGTRVADWRVRGFGQFDMNRESAERRPDFPRSETAWMSEAPRRAVEAATANFVAGFERVPELIRLVRNLPLDGANVPAARQGTRDTAPARQGVEASYSGAFALHVQRATVPQPHQELVKDEPKVPYLLPVRLTLQNRGTHRLLLDPADAHWVPDGYIEDSQKPISPLPAPVVSALIAGRPFGMAVGVMSPGVGMLPALFAALFSAAENERQKKDLAVWTAAIDRELLDAGIAAAGASRGGVIYFARTSKLDAGTLVIPVIDLDDALRYTVRVPLPAE
jgi:hypothetical protein